MKDELETKLDELEDTINGVNEGEDRERRLRLVKNLIHEKKIEAVVRICVELNRMTMPTEDVVDIAKMCNKVLDSVFEW